jgi:uncharacterized protein (TIGR03435 family)
MKIAAFVLFVPMLFAQSVIVPSKSDDQSIHMKENSFEAQGVTLKELLQIAYKMPPSRILGPVWMNENSYDVKSTPKDTLRQTLEQGFSLKTRTEPRMMSVWVLSGQIAATPAAPGRVHDGDVHLTGKGLTMASIAAQLTQALHRPVVDETNLQGRYSIDLAYDVESPGDLIEAVRRQLGLELKEGKRQLDVLVVESAKAIH